MSTLFRSWWRSALDGSRNSRRNLATRRPRFVPNVTLLEDRLVPSYVFQTIDDPKGVLGNFPGSINSSGRIAGTYVDAAGIDHGYLLSGGQYTTIDDPNTGPGGFNEAETINASGKIVGAYSDANGLAHGYLLSGGQYTTLDDPNAVNGTFAFGINARGQVVGEYHDVNNTYHGFLLSKGQYTTLDDPNAGSGAFQGTLPFEINASGNIVGEYIDANNVPHGFLLNGGQFTTIDDPNAGSGANQGTYAGFINDHGQIAGGYTDTAGVSHGYLLVKGQYSTVDDPAAGPLGSAIAGINDAGTLVGFYYDAPGIGHGYLATQAHGKSAVAKTAATFSVASPSAAALAISLTPEVAATPPGSTAETSRPAPVARYDGSLLASRQLERLLPPTSIGLSGAAHATHSAAVDRLFAEIGSAFDDSVEQVNPLASKV
jgi:probable HAF family extracellular repeat protein